MVEKLWKPPELAEEKGETLKRIGEFSRHAELGKDEQKHLTVYEEKTLLKYMLYNQNVLTFGDGGRDAFINSLKELKSESEKKGLETLAKVIDHFGYVPQDMSYDVLAPYLHQHGKITGPARFSTSRNARAYAHKRAGTLVELSLSEGSLKESLWKPRTTEHLEYWVWWELKNRDIFNNWPFISNLDHTYTHKPAYDVMYKDTKSAYYLKPEFRKEWHEFIELHRKEIDEIIKKFNDQLASLEYEQSGRDIFLGRGLTRDWITAFEIKLPDALELAKSPGNWMKKGNLRKYSGIKLPRDSSVETWKANIEYSRQNGIEFKNNKDILMADPEKLKELHAFFVRDGINFNEFLKLFKGDLKRTEENYKFCLEKHIDFKECLNLLVIPNEQLKENYELYAKFWEMVKPPEYPYLLMQPTNVLKRRFGVLSPQAI